MFLDTLYILDGNDGFLYSVDTNTNTVKTILRTLKEARSILVAQNQVDLYTVSRENNVITRINKGVSLGDIRVGKMPYGICEDPNGIIYVTNYLDNTVTVIQNNIPDPRPIMVDKGPRGIVSDSNGTIWVACYLSNTVVKIVNRTVVDRIEVAFNPEGITCDIQNNIWVACSGSNVVVKIAKSKRVLTKETGKRPVAVVTDLNLNVYVANYEDDTVTVLNQISTSTQSTTIGVGDGPSALSIDSKGYVYVASNISGEDIYKINPKTREVIGQIHVCKSPAAFGDFTGCSTYNVFNRIQAQNADNGVAKNANEFLAALEPTFKITKLVETSTECTFTIDSDVLNLNKFNHFTLNGFAPSADGTFTIDKDDIGNILILKGYFHSSDDSPIIFKPLVFRNVFSVKVGMVDKDYKNFTLLYEKIIDFNTKDIVASVVNTGAYDRGHVVCLVPNRIYTISRDYLTVNSGYAFGNGWLPDPETQAEELEAIKESGISNDDKLCRTILFNPDPSDAASLFFFHFYRIEP